MQLEVGLGSEHGTGRRPRLAENGGSAIGGLLRARSRGAPFTIAAGEYGGASLTFRDWEQRSNRAAAGLVAAGVRPGDRVALLHGIDAWIEFAISFVAAVKASATVVTMGGHWTTIDLERVLGDAKPAVVMTALTATALPSGSVTLAELEARAGAVRAQRLPAAPVAELQYRAGAMRAPTSRAWSEDELLALAGIVGYQVQSGAWDGVWPQSHRAFLHAFPPGSVGATAAVLAPLGWRRGASVAVRTASPIGAVDPGSFSDALRTLRPVAIGLSASAARALDATGVLQASAMPSVQRVLIDVDPATDVAAMLSAALPRVTVSPMREPRAVDQAKRQSKTGNGVPATAAYSSPRPELVPALTSQVGMVWHEQLAPGSFNLSPLVRRYRGDLDIDALESALSVIVHRHAALRTTFRLVDGELMQAISASAPVTLPITDLSGAGGEDAVEAELARLIREARIRPIDLTEGPLFAPSLVRLGPREHVMITRVHHSVFDDWSVGLFRAELATCYRAFHGGEPLPLPPLPTSYAAICARRFRALHGDAGAADREFWRHELAGTPATLELDIGDPVAPRGVPMPAGSPVRSELPSELVSELTAFARRQRATLFTVVLAAVGIVVARESAADDLVMSMLVADRDRPDDAAVIGCFAKKVVLRVSLSGDPSFATLVARAKAAVVHGMAHKTPSFENVVQDCLDSVAAVHGLSARVSVKFQTAVASTAPLQLPELEVSPVRSAAPIPGAHFQARRDSGESVHDVTPWGAGLYAGTFLELTLHDTADGVALVATGVFHAPAVRTLLDRLIAVLPAVVHDPDAPLSQALGAADRSATSDRSPAGEAEERIDLDGFAVEPARIAAALEERLGDGRVAVEARTGADGRQRLVASIRSPGAYPPDLDAMRVQLWRRLPGYAWPAVAEIVNPRATGGRDAEADASPGDAHQFAPQDAVESSDEGAAVQVIRATLLALWAEAAGSQPIPSNSNYWQVFSFLDAIAEARRLGIRVDAQAVMRNRTVHSLAVDLISRERSNPT